MQEEEQEQGQERERERERERRLPPGVAQVEVELKAPHDMRHLPLLCTFYALPEDIKGIIASAATKSARSSAVLGESAEGPARATASSRALGTDHSTGKHDASKLHSSGKVSSLDDPPVENRQVDTRGDLDLPRPAVHAFTLPTTPTRPIRTEKPQEAGPVQTIDVRARTPSPAAVGNVPAGTTAVQLLAGLDAAATGDDGADNSQDESQEQAEKDQRAARDSLQSEAFPHLGVFVAKLPRGSGPSEGRPVRESQAHPFHQYDRIAAINGEDVLDKSADDVLSLLNANCATNEKPIKLKLWRHNAVSKHISAKATINVDDEDFEPETKSIPLRQQQQQHAKNRESLSLLSTTSGPDDADTPQSSHQGSPRSSANIANFMSSTTSLASIATPATTPFFRQMGKPTTSSSMADPDVLKEDKVQSPDSTARTRTFERSSISESGVPQNNRRRSSIDVNLDDGVIRRFDEMHARAEEFKTEGRHVLDAHDYLQKPKLINIELNAHLGEGRMVDVMKRTDDGKIIVKKVIGARMGTPLSSLQAGDVIVGLNGLLARDLSLSAVRGLLHSLSYIVVSIARYPSIDVPRDASVKGGPASNPHALDLSARGQQQPHSMSDSGAMMRASDPFQRSTHLTHDPHGPQMSLLTKKFSRSTLLQTQVDDDSDLHKAVLRRDKESGTLGVTVEWYSQHDGDDVVVGVTGAIITKIAPTSKGEAAYLLREGDQIMSVNGMNVADLAFPQIVELLRCGGDEVSVIVARKRKRGLSPSSAMAMHRLAVSPGNAPRAQPRRSSIATGDDVAAQIRQGRSVDLLHTDFGSSLPNVHKKASASTPSSPRGSISSLTADVLLHNSPSAGRHKGLIPHQASSSSLVSGSLEQPRADGAHVSRHSASTSPRPKFTASHLQLSPQLHVGSGLSTRSGQFYYPRSEQSLQEAYEREQAMLQQQLKSQEQALLRLYESRRKQEQEELRQKEDADEMQWRMQQQNLSMYLDNRPPSSLRSVTPTAESTPAPTSTVSGAQGSPALLASSSSPLQSTAATGQDHSSSHADPHPSTTNGSNSSSPSGSYKKETTCHPKIISTFSDKDILALRVTRESLNSLGALLSLEVVPGRVAEDGNDGCGCVRVDIVAHDSSLHLAGLRGGDYILAVNDTLLLSQDPATSAKALHTATVPFYLLIARDTTPATTAKQLIHFEMRHVPTSPPVLSMHARPSFLAKSEAAIVIKRVKTNRIIHNHDNPHHNISPGDVVLYLNGHCFIQDASLSKVPAALGGKTDLSIIVLRTLASRTVNGRPFNQVVWEPKAAPLLPGESLPQTREVELHRLQGGFGLSILGPKEAGDIPGVFILGWTPASAAAESGMVFPGDRILAVNGHDASAGSHERVLTMIKQSQESVVLLLTYEPQRCAYRKDQERKKRLLQQQQQQQQQQQLELQRARSHDITGEGDRRPVLVIERVEDEVDASQFMPTEALRLAESAEVDSSKSEEADLLACDNDNALSTSTQLEAVSGVDGTTANDAAVYVGKQCTTEVWLAEDSGSFRPGERQGDGKEHVDGDSLAASLSEPEEAPYALRQPSLSTSQVDFPMPDRNQESIVARAWKTASSSSIGSPEKSPSEPGLERKKSFPKKRVQLHYHTLEPDFVAESIVAKAWKPAETPPSASKKRLVVPSLADTVVEVPFTLRAHHLGLRFSQCRLSGTREAYTMVADISATGAAAITGLFSIGDLILEVNGRDVTRMRHHAVCSFIDECEAVASVQLSFMTFRVIKKRNQVELVHETLAAVREGQTYGLGLAPELPCTIAVIKEGSSAAERDVAVGDEILRVNGKSVENMPVQQVAFMIKHSAPSGLRLSLRRKITQESESSVQGDPQQDAPPSSTNTSANTSANNSVATAHVDSDGQS